MIQNKLMQFWFWLYSVSRLWTGYVQTVPATDKTVKARCWCLCQTKRGEVSWQETEVYTKVSQCTMSIYMYLCWWEGSVFNNLHVIWKAFCKYESYYWDEIIMQVLQTSRNWNCSLNVRVPKPEVMWKEYFTHAVGAIIMVGENQSHPQVVGRPCHLRDC